MSAPQSLARRLLVQAQRGFTLLCTDGGANDNKGVEVTGRTDGSINSWITGGSVSVVDAGLAIVATGNLTAAASTAAIVGQTGPGQVVIVNTEVSGGKTMYVGLTAASSASFPLVPGASLSMRLADVTTLFVFGTGGTFGWLLAR